MTRRHETRQQRRRRRCPTAKIAYRSLEEASAAKAQIEQRGERLMTVYECHLCPFFHLTTETVLVPLRPVQPEPHSHGHGEQQAGNSNAQ